MEVELRIGLHHEALYPAASQDPALHERTLHAMLEWSEFTVIDTACLGAPDRQQREAATLRASGKEVIYHVPLMGTMPGCDPNATDPKAMAKTRDLVQPHLDLAAAAGASLVVVSSGRQPRAAQREGALHGWHQYLAWVAKEAGKRGLPVAIEPHDQGIHRNLLIGPTGDAVNSAMLVHEQGAPAVGLLVDMAHLALLCERFDDALRRAAPLLWHVHLSNAIMRDTSHEWFGDQHPPIGLAGSEYHTPHLASFLRILLAVNYFDRTDAALTFEMRPYYGTDERGSALRWLRILGEACELAAAAE